MNAQQDEVDGDVDGLVDVHDAAGDVAVVAEEEVEQALLVRRVPKLVRS